MGAIPQIAEQKPSVAATALTQASIETASLAKIDIPKPKVTAEAQALSAAPVSPAPPSASGAGYRIVFDQSDQRVWLIKGDGSVERTYLV